MPVMHAMPWDCPHHLLLVGRTIARRRDFAVAGGDFEVDEASAEIALAMAMAAMESAKQYPASCRYLETGCATPLELQITKLLTFDSKKGLTQRCASAKRRYDGLNIMNFHNFTIN